MSRFLRPLLPLLLAWTLAAPAVARPVVVAAAAEASAPFCGPGVAPRFAAGFAPLTQLLGSRAGRPTECEHVDAATGDTLQHTTTGLAYYRKRANRPAFTNGSDHWALFASGLGHWSGGGPDPPALTAEDASYLQEVGPLAAEARDLGVHLLDAARGLQDDPSAVTALDAVGSLRDEMESVNTRLAALQPGPATANAHRLLQQIDGSVLAAMDLLVRALQALQDSDPAAALDLLGQVNAAIAGLPDQAEQLRQDLAVLSS